METSKNLLPHEADQWLSAAESRYLEVSTFFLPFNKGRGTGAGNLDNPNGYREAEKAAWAVANPVTPVPVSRRR
jgi:hypothetical protein